MRLARVSSVRSLMSLPIQPSAANDFGHPKGFTSQALLADSAFQHSEWPTASVRSPRILAKATPLPKFSDYGQWRFQTSDQSGVIRYLRQSAHSERHGFGRLVLPRIEGKQSIDHRRYFVTGEAERLDRWGCDRHREAADGTKQSPPDALQTPGRDEERPSIAVRSPYNCNSSRRSQSHGRQRKSSSHCKPVRCAWSVHHPACWDGCYRLGGYVRQP